MADTTPRGIYRVEGKGDLAGWRWAWVDGLEQVVKERDYYYEPPWRHLPTAEEYDPVKAAKYLPLIEALEREIREDVEAITKYERMPENRSPNAERQVRLLAERIRNDLARQKSYQLEIGVPVRAT